MSTALLAPQIKNLRFHDFKSVDDATGLFSGYLSVFSNLDSYKDIVEPGAFQKTIQDARGRKSKYLFPILWQHQSDEPIGGFLDMKEDGHGLFVKGQIDLNTEKGQRAYSGLKMGYLDGLSIGYDTIKQKYTGEIRHLLEVRMWEGSIVTFPANPATRVSSVKTACGSTSFPLAGRDVAWDASKARSEYQTWAKNADGELDPGKLKQVHFYVDESADPKTIGAYKLPFCFIENGSPQAVPKGIMAVAGVLQGSMGGADIGGAAEAVKSKVASYYSKMRSAFDDPDIIPPWNKGRDFNAVLQDRAPGEMIEDLYDLMSALMTSVIEQICDCEDAQDGSKQVGSSLGQFQKAVLSWVEEALASGIGMGGDDEKSLSLAHFGLSARSMKRAVRHYSKEGRTLSTSNRVKISTALDTISSAIKDLQSLLDATNIYLPGDQSEESEPPKNEEPVADMTSSTTGPIDPVIKEEEHLVPEEMMAFFQKMREGIAKKEEVLWHTKIPG